MVGRSCWFIIIIFDSNFFQLNIEYHIGFASPKMGMVKPPWNHHFRRVGSASNHLGIPPGAGPDWRCPWRRNPWRRSQDVVCWELGSSFVKRWLYDFEARETSHTVSKTLSAVLFSLWGLNHYHQDPLTEHPISGYVGKWWKKTQMAIEKGKMMIILALLLRREGHRWSRSTKAQDPGARFGQKRHAQRWDLWWRICHPKKLVELLGDLKYFKKMVGQIMTGRDLMLDVSGLSCWLLVSVGIYRCNQWPNLHHIRGFDSALELHAPSVWCIIAIAK